MKFNKVFTEKKYKNHLLWLKDNNKGERLEI